MDSYSSSIEQQASLERPDLHGSMEQSNMSRSQSAPMLDDEMGFSGNASSNHNHSQQGGGQKPAIPHKAYHFDHNYNPQVHTRVLALNSNLTLTLKSQSQSFSNPI